MKLIKEVGLKRILKYALFSLWQMVFDLLSFSPLRVWWLRLAGAKIGTETVIDKIDFFNLDRTGLRGLQVGRRCFLGRGVMLDVAGRVILENWVTISPRATVLSHINVGSLGHPLLERYRGRVFTTTLKRGSFIGAGAIILGGVTVGAEALVGAGAVVTRNIPAHSVAVGVPAKKVKTITS